MNILKSKLFEDFSELVSKIFSLNMFNSHRNYGMMKCLKRLLEIQQTTIDKMSIKQPKYWVLKFIWLEYFSNTQFKFGFCFSGGAGTSGKIKNKS